MLLFGFTAGAPLVTNPPQERHASPLREDARPMDGLVHAAYVLARITLFYTQLLQSGHLSDDEASTAAAALAQCREQFNQADKVIARHAIFTEPGAAAYNAARSWMHA
jgi:HEXXH motif-containing protein